MSANLFVLDGEIVVHEDSWHEGGYAPSSMLIENQNPATLIREAFGNLDWNIAGELDIPGRWRMRIERIDDEQ